MDSESVAILAIVGVVFSVVIFGLWARSGFSGVESPIGLVISDPVAEGGCYCALSTPVCAAIGHRLDEYASACHAGCAGAKTVFVGRCSGIPHME